MRKTKIVCTIGPACESEEMLREMILAGMNVARINFSHGSHEEHLVKINRIKKLRTELGRPVALLLDTKGPEIRTKKLENKTVSLVTGQDFVLTNKDIVGNDQKVSITFAALPEYVKAGTTILLDDGLIELSVKSVTASDIVCTVKNDGVLGENKGMNLPGTHINMPFLNDRDKNDILFGIANNFDFIALSFVRSAQDVLEARHFIERQGPSTIELIAKIENSQGVENIHSIINTSNGIMVARGDMGVEIPFEELPHIQKTIIRACFTSGKKVITATQMLESMIQKPRPTRAEITDVANAIYDGTSAIMLSGETASGKYPLDALKTMVKIAEKTESNINYNIQGNRYSQLSLINNITNAISHATCTTAQDLNAAAIVAVTRSGASARMISRFRPLTPIIAVTPTASTYHQLSLSWGVYPVMNEYQENALELFKDALDKVISNGYVKNGDLIVITGSSEQHVGTTNTLQVHVIGDIFLKGKGNGLGAVTGRICVFSDGEQDASRFVAGDILVVSKTTNEMLHLCRQAAGIITEEDSESCGIAAAGLALNIPVIYGATDATTMLRSGVILKLDSNTGFVEKE